jgi:iron complex transport system ATP-binding protein
VIARGTATPAVGVAVQAERVCVRLGGREVLRGVSISVQRGGWLALIGPNGAGKTTFLRALAGLVSFSGSVTLDGRAVRSSSRRELARLVALVPQIPALPPALTVAEYVLLGRTPHMGYLATETRADRLAAERAIRSLELQPFVKRPLGELSGGEVQRAVLARALAQEAPILLLDEPTTGLDLGHEQQALELVDRLRHDGGLTVISAVHDLTIAAQYAKELLLLDEGRVVGAGAAAAVLTEQTIARYFDARVRVVRENGSVFVMPVRGGPG